jgi:hypothetical protein
LTDLDFLVFKKDHGDGHPDVGGRVLDAGAMRQEGFHNTAAKSELAAG